MMPRNPTTSDANVTSGVSLDCRKALAMRPEMPMVIFPLAR
jgi:hypothetical protein